MSRIIPLVRPTYYGETPAHERPAFWRMLPGALGYIGMYGEVIHYGREPEMKMPVFKPQMPQARPPAHVENKLRECQRCGEITRLTRHHVTPKEEVARGRKAQGVVKICRPCHDRLHVLFTNQQLADGGRSLALDLNR